MANNVTWEGRLTKDPVLEYIGEKQTPVCKFTIASDKSGPRERNGEKVKPNFIEIAVWFNPEGHEKYLEKGQHVVIFGEMVHNTWTTADDEYRERWYCKADRTVWGAKARNGSNKPEAPAEDHNPEGEDAF